MRSLSDIASSLDGYDPHALHLGLAKRFLAELAVPVATIERVAVRAALGRVLAEAAIATIDVPTYDNSAMDGYALRGAELLVGRETTLKIDGKAFAGRGFDGVASPRACVRIMTGAPMPAGLDTVVPQELVTVDGNGAIKVPAGSVTPGDNVRRAGEDLARGSCALPVGRVLTPADIGLLASIGTVEVPVFRRLRVAFFSTGSELRSIGQPLDAGCVYDSNRYTLWAMLTRLGLDVLDLGVIADDPGSLLSAFMRVAGDADVVISSGGVGSGDADHTKQVMAQAGDVLFWSLALRPGRPFAVGRLNADSRRAGRDERGALLFGLPGNPVAVMTSFHALVREVLTRMSGATVCEPLLMSVPSADPIRKKPGRTEFVRARVSIGDGGRLVVTSTGPQGSGVLRSMSEANAFIVLAHEQGSVQAGDLVDVQLFDGLL